MRCFVLGTGGMMPMPGRRLSSVIVRPSSRMYQFDCGEGIQVSIKALRLGIKPLSVVAITHLHADHCLGLPGVLMFRAQAADPGPLVILGPPGVGRFLRHVLEDLACFINFPLAIREWDPAGDPVAFADDEVRILWAPLEHGVRCLGYRLEEHQRPGRFDPERALALGVPAGPLFGRLQRGEAVTLPSGVQVSPGEVMGPPRRGRAVAYCTDTAPCENLERLCREVDVAFVEAMFLPEHEEEGRKKQHLTAPQALAATRRAGAARTVVIHLSPRYGPEELGRLRALLKELDPSAQVGRELEELEVPLPS